MHIGQMAALSVRELIDFFATYVAPSGMQEVVDKILKNIIERLDFLSGVGLEYVTLDRRAQTLSGGEAQRIRLATQIGSKLEGVIYVLDEPSIGLHSRDNDLLIANLHKLANLGNTVIVVEHDEDIMRACDYIVDI
jgi:excinuclease ABC subunit A